MENTPNPIVYAVNSDLDDGILYAEFATKEEAIEYAKQHMDKLPFVDELEVSYDANGDIDNVFSYKTIWAHDEEEGAAVESEEDYWDMMAATYEEEQANKHDLGDTTWFESMDNLVETLEENEDEVECKECFELFPKADCMKVDIGYVCPTCAECGTVSEDETFKIDFPEYEKFHDPEDMIPVEPTIPVEAGEEMVPEDPEAEIDPISTPEDAVPFLVNDEEEAIAGYERAAEVVADSDLENKEEILDTIEHIVEEEEEHIEELTELVEPKEEEVPEESEDENDPISEDEVEEIEDPEAEPVEEAMSEFQRGLIDRLPKMTKAELQKELESGDSLKIFYGDPREPGIRSRDYEVTLVDGIYEVTYWEETYNDDFTDSELAEEFDNIDDLWDFMVHFMEDDDFTPEYNYVEEEVTEHVNEEHPAIESDQELEGTDNAVVDCKIADVITHSEDEKPLNEEFDRVRAAAQCARHCYDFYNAIKAGVSDKQIKPYGKAAYKFVKDQYGLTGKKAEDLLISGYAVWKLLNESLSEGFAMKVNKDTEAENAEFYRLCDEIGIKTVSDLDSFVKEVAEKEGNVLDKLRSYRAELGPDFKIKEELTEQLDLSHGYDHIKSVATLVHKAVENLTKDNRVGTRPDGMSFYVLSDKRSADPEKMKKVILDALAAEGYEPDEVQFVDKGQVYGYVVGKIKMMARATMSYQKREGLTEKFTPEEMEEFNMDEDGNSLDGYDTYVRCGWCEEIFPDTDCDFEYNLGWLCDRCYSAIASRGERLMIVKNPTEEDFARVLTEEVKMTRDELRNKFGTDDVDLINAGREEEERVELTEDADEDTFEPTSVDPEEKPKKVKMANTESTSGMDFEAACAKFGVEL